MTPGEETQPDEAANGADLNHNDSHTLASDALGVLGSIPSGIVPNTDVHDEDARTVSIALLTMVSLPYLGAFFTASAVVTQTVPFLLLLGASPLTITGMFVLGSVATIFVQPVVGYLSDASNSPLGRRRKYIMIFVALLVLGICLYILADVIRRGGVVSPRYGRYLAFLGLLVMVVSLNAVQVPLRTLATDMASTEQQKVIHGVFGVLAGTGAAASYGLAFFMDPVAHCQVYFGLAASVTTATTMVALYQRHEPLREDTGGAIEGNACSNACNEVCVSWLQLLNAPLTARMVYLAHFIGWAALQSFFSANTTWMGAYMYGGEPGSANFAQGVKVAVIGQAMKSILQVPLSAGIPILAKHCGLQIIYCGAYGLMAALLGLMFVLPPVASAGEWSAYLAMLLAAGMVVPISVTQVVPYAILGELLKGHSQLGVYMAGLNNANMAGVLLCFILMGPIANGVGWNYVILVASILALCSLFPTLWLWNEARNSHTHTPLGAAAEASVQTPRAYPDAGRSVTEQNPAAAS